VAVADVSRPAPLVTDWTSRALNDCPASRLAAGVALVLLLLMVGCFALGYGSVHIGVTQRSPDRSAVRLDLGRPEGRASIDRIGVLSGRLTMLEGEAAPLASRPVADLARHGDLGTGLSRLDNELARLEAMVARWPTSPSPTIPRAWLFPADGSSAGVASVSSPGITWPVDVGHPRCTCATSRLATLNERIAELRRRIDFHNAQRLQPRGMR
jgi:hypothetical protein